MKAQTRTTLTVVERACFAVLVAIVISIWLHIAMPIWFVVGTFLAMGLPAFVISMILREDSKKRAK